MAVFLAPIINTQQVDNNGDPLSGGTIEVYLAGTSTPATTFSDKAGLVPNTWPIVLNTLGVNNQGEIWLTGGASYKFVIKNSTGIVQRTLDNVSGINDTTVSADQWILFPAPPTFVSATSFTLVGDQTQTFQVGRRVKTLNTGGVVYSTITGSQFSSPNTTVTVRNDSGVLDSGLSQVSYGVISVSDTSLPGGLPVLGQCRLIKAGANLTLIPFNGNIITVGRSLVEIPAIGVNLAPTALTPGTLYYIYAFINGAVLNLEASTTTHTQDAVTGVEIKTGDSTRTLVGMARVIAGPGWSDSPTARLVVSWFNRRPIPVVATYTANRGYSSGSYGEPNSEIQNAFLCWNTDAVTASLTGAAVHTNANISVWTTIAVDGGTQDGASNFQQATVGNSTPIAAYFNGFLSEGFHVTTLFALNSGGVGVVSYLGNASAGVRCTLQTTIQG